MGTITIEYKGLTQSFYVAGETLEEGGEALAEIVESHMDGFKENSIMPF